MKTFSDFTSYEIYSEREVLLYDKSTTVLYVRLNRCGDREWPNILCLQIKVYIIMKDLIKVKIYLDCTMYIVNKKISHESVKLVEKCRIFTWFEMEIQYG